MDAWDTVASPAYLNKRDNDEARRLKVLAILQNQYPARNKILMVTTFGQTISAYDEAIQAWLKIPRDGPHAYE